LTWAPFFVAAIVALALRSGWRRALAIGAGALAFSFALYAVAVWTFDWSPHQLVVQLLLAQSHSGFQLGVAAGIVAAVLLIWWPLLLTAAPAGARRAHPSASSSGRPPPAVCSWSSKERSSTCSIRSSRSSRFSR
jgi:hypothetical protein